MRFANSRRFGKWRYVLKWDSGKLDVGEIPASSKRLIQEKKRMARMVGEDYRKDGWLVKVTTYHQGRDFKVWAYPK